jgi:hypothetical protein
MQLANPISLVWQKGCYIPKREISLSRKVYSSSTQELKSEPCFTLHVVIEHVEGNLDYFSWDF